MEKSSGECINNIRYTYGTVTIEKTEEGLQRIMEQVNDVNEEHGMKLIAKKIKFMVVSKNHNKDIAVRIDSQFLGRTRTFSYLRCHIIISLDRDMNHK